MPQDVVVLFIHGINTSSQDYYLPLRDRILDRLPKALREHAIFRSVFWADIVRGRQQEYLSYAELQAGFKASTFHKMVIEGLGDAAAYQKTENRANSAYYEIQRRIRKVIRDAALPGHDTRPLVVVAHSLGCHIMSSYAWDLHKFKANHGAHDPRNLDDEEKRFVAALANKTAFERLDTFAGFITMGCNMPLFTFTFGPQHVFPMTYPYRQGVAPAFPGPALDDASRGRAGWRNYYSLNDPLGYPLKPLNDAYDNEPLLTDNRVVSEGWYRLLGRFAMMQAHIGYWKNATVASGAASLIEGLIGAADPEKVSGAPPVLFPQTRF